MFGLFVPPNDCTAAVNTVTVFPSLAPRYHSVKALVELT